MSAHTPGPWEVCSTYVRTRFDINEGGGACIAQIDTITAEHAANARLIAAAPDLLSACIAERLASVYDNDPGSHEANEAIKELVLLGYFEDGDLTPGEFASALRSSAIAKATGDQP